MPRETELLDRVCVCLLVPGFARGHDDIAIARGRSDVSVKVCFYGMHCEGKVFTGDSPFSKHVVTKE